MARRELAQVLLAQSDTQIRVADTASRRTRKRLVLPKAAARGLLASQVLAPFMRVCRVHRAQHQGQHRRHEGS